MVENVRVYPTGTRKIERSETFIFRETSELLVSEAKPLVSGKLEPLVSEAKPLVSGKLLSFW
jgi:hypothetical protein